MTLATINRKPVKTSHSTPILFVHGAWHDSRCWDEFFLPYFAEKGWNVYALDLRGHGKSPGFLWLASIHNYVADVAEVAAQIEKETGKRPAIVGHSMGGFITQHYLGKHQAPAGVLLGSIPVRGFLPAFLRFIRRHPIPALKTLVTMQPKYMMNTPELFQDLCLSDSMPKEQVMKYFAGVQAESFRVALDSMLLGLPSPKKVTCPLLVLGAEKDRFFTQYEEKRTAEAYGTTAKFYPDMAHNMMVEKDWRAVADRIMSWLESCVD